MKPLLLVLHGLTDGHRAQLAQSLDLIYAPTPAERAAAVAAHGARVQLVLTIGATGLTAAEMDAMPQLSLVCALGAGYENIDVAHAKQRGVVVATGAGTNEDCVADHAMGLLLAAVRGIAHLDQQTRQGVWRDVLPLPPNVSGRRLGLLGLGGIGRKIARRAEGFDIEIGYHNRSPRSDVAYRYFDQLTALAAWADFLVVATPGGPATRHLVNAEVLQALGPRGTLVNIARGSVVDTAALAAALREGRLGAAGLDVYESEPRPPAELIELPNVVLTPHVAGWSPEAVQRSVDQFLANVQGHLSGQGPVAPV
ncbi:2-hydroxyacid dehydrogenase [Curvibacter sp. HBC28]|uniref:2-hydroxyacid dehydrogenase n=1 Tax=Curvibacter microcysteis TaxID=3026419 RepID=A0ABT5MB30_9BURK|nr:2-hydroxyacid dehydrogenase [Curvibacter sp. HBC28]MDD0813107.1 2-hydroxyacid dehydrogenase [Curvibacter sp. HBC28]